MLHCSRSDDSWTLKFITALDLPLFAWEHTSWFKIQSWPLFAWGHTSWFKIDKLSNPYSVKPPRQFCSLYLWISYPSFLHQLVVCPLVWWYYFVVSILLLCKAFSGTKINCFYNKSINIYWGMGNVILNPFCVYDLIKMGWALDLAALTEFSIFFLLLPPLLLIYLIIPLSINFSFF